MGRLIDADALIEAMKKTEEEYEDAMTCPSWWSAYNVIKEQPTAYDVDAVVAELEEERGISYADFDEYAYRYELDLTDNDDWFCKGLARAIDIVKRGGVE